MNIVEEQDRTIARLTRLLEDRNEEIRELRTRLEETEKKAQAFHAVLSGLGMNNPMRLAKETPIDAFQIGRGVRVRIEARMKEEAAFLHRRRAMGFIGRVLTIWKEIGA